MGPIAFLTFYFALTNAWDPASYTDSQALSDTFTLHWRVDTTYGYLYLAMEANTTGWLGFGIGEPTSGSMPGADMVIGWLADDGGHVQDRFAVAKSEPLLDSCQNWEYLSATRLDSKTIIEARRLLVTGDPQDRPIVEGRTRVVWAHSSDGSIQLQYHGVNRHATFVTFYGGPYVDPLENIKKDPNVHYFDVFNNYTLQAVATYYHQLDIDIPLNRSIDAHIIGFEALIKPETARFVHHFVLKGYTNESDLHNPMTQAFISGWAPGVEPVVFPNEAGVRVSWTDPDDNPALEAGIVETSGLRFYYTHQLRRFDAGYLVLGDGKVMRPDPIPQGTSISSYEYSCDSSCTGSWPQLHVYTVMFHMHMQGTQMWGSHWRDGQQLRETNRVDFWDFGFQQATPVSFDIMPGDRINTHCVYQQNPSRPTPFGQPSESEMCVQFIAYYPRIPRNNGLCSFFYSANSSMGPINTTFCNNDFVWDENHTFPIPDVIRDPVLEISRAFGDLDANESFVCQVSGTLNIIPHVFSVIVLFILILIV
jgi:hypothetical protein